MEYSLFGKLPIHHHSLHPTGYASLSLSLSLESRLYMYTQTSFSLNHHPSELFSHSSKFNTMKIPSLIFSSLALLLVCVSGLGPRCARLNQGSSRSTLQVMHVNSPCSPFRPLKPISWEDSVLQTLTEDQARVLYLASLVARKKTNLPISSGKLTYQSPTYIVEAKIGTPPQTMHMAMDTGNDVSWVPCTGCVGCSSSTVFNSTNSSSYKGVGCNDDRCKQVPNPGCSDGGACGFNFTYGSSTVTANLSQDSVTLATDVFTNYAFGCIKMATGKSVPPQGLLGLGRGSLSLLSQTIKQYNNIFSYCLPAYSSSAATGSLRLGPVGQPQRIKTTLLLRNPRRPSLYYVNLIAIYVGRKLVDLPAGALAFDPKTGAGTVIDSGTVFTRFVTTVYTAVRDEFKKRVRGPTGKLNATQLGGFDTCYTVPVTVPTITLVFSGMNVTLPTDNLMIRSSVSNTSCLAMAAAPNNVNSALNVIASMQQQNHRILFTGTSLGVARERCTTY
ncbi:aspartyl protease AED3 isoform X2 [Malania oleifera]|uniref:aspartyl protease AED3 isoform X2 n=1 Tax=Malania oleifera TaxID=397392 RepID=UPI0025AE697D|nr:aspartyl protease AED3 isoform X2 [Malania oleifera]